MFSAGTRDYEIRPMEVLFSANSTRESILAALPAWLTYGDKSQAFISVNENAEPVWWYRAPLTGSLVGFFYKGRFEAVGVFPMSAALDKIQVRDEGVVVWSGDWAFLARYDRNPDLLTVTRSVL